MTDPISLRDYGRLETEVAHLTISMNQLQSDVKAMRDLMEQSKGGWKTLVLIGGAASSFGAAASALLHWGDKIPK